MSSDEPSSDRRSADANSDGDGTDEGCKNGGTITETDAKDARGSSNPGGPSGTDGDSRRSDTTGDVGQRVGALLGEATDRRGWIVRTGIAITAVLAVVMLAFVAVDWLRHYPLAGTVPAVEAVYRIIGVDPHAETMFDQFMIAGAWLDHILGITLFRFTFYWRSIATGVLIGIVAPLVGSFVVHRQMALIGETLAHTAFAGIAIGLVLAGVFEWWGAPLMLVALGVGVLGALGVQWLTDRTETYGDVPIAIMLVGSFAVGTLLIEWARGIGTVTIDIEAYLFGNITIVPSSSARLMAVLSIGVVAVVALTYKQLLFITFDEQAARVAQVDVDRYNTLLVVMTAVVVVGAMQILGVILVAAMLVVPVAAASQLARSFREMVLLSILFGELSIVAGFAFAFSLDLPPGGSIVVASIVLYALAVVRSTGTMSLRTH